MIPAKCRLYPRMRYLLYESNALIRFWLRLNTSVSSNFAPWNGLKRNLSHLLNKSYFVQGMNYRWILKSAVLPGEAGILWIKTVFWNEPKATHAARITTFKVHVVPLQSFFSIISSKMDDNAGFKSGCIHNFPANNCTFFSSKSNF